MRFKLLAPHYIDDRLLEAGEVIGEGTQVPFTYPDGSPRTPSPEMEGLDEESAAAVAAVISRAYPLFADLPATFTPNGADPTAETVDMADANQTAALGVPKPAKVK